MKVAEDLTGKTFGAWNVVGPCKRERRKSGRTEIKWRCVCECGRENWILISALKGGTSSRCRWCACRKSCKWEDLTGKKFGKLEVIRFDNPPGKPNKSWECRCECGRLSWVTTGCLNSSKGPRSCLKCRRKAYSGDEWNIEKGSVYGKWKVLEVEIKDNQRFCRCQCVCGFIGQIPATELRHGYRSGCRRCKVEAQGKPAYSTLWQNLLNNARDRGFEVGITKEYIIDLLEKQGFKCKITGVEIEVAITHKKHMRGGTTASVDRIDSRLGYVEGNVQWVHKVVNKMKGTLREEEFFFWCKKVVEVKTNAT